MKKVLLILIVILFCLCFVCVALEWPVSDKNFSYGFGSMRGAVLRGVEYNKAGNNIVASGDGELLFASTEKTLPGGYPVPNGSLLTIRHASEILSIYTGLDRDSASLYLKNVHDGDIVGSIPESKDNAYGVSFYTFDTKERRYVNPLIVLPNLEDDKAPIVRSLNVKNSYGEKSIDKEKNIKQGEYFVIIEAEDTTASGNKIAPFGLALFIDGIEKANVVFDSAMAQNGKSYFFSTSKLDEDSCILPDGRFCFGPFSFSKGRTSFLVLVSDYAGNKREQNYSINIQ